MERDGVLVDARLLARPEPRRSASACWRSEQQAYQLAGSPFNLGSPKQLGEILFERMKLPVARKTATGQPSHRRGGAARSSPPTTRCPRCCSSTARCRSSSRPYTDKLPQMVNRAHRPRAHDVRAGDRGDRAARVGGSEPAEHPGAHRRRPAHPRGVHRAAGHIAIVSADYSQIELRIMAHLSGDAALVRAFRRRRRHPPRDGGRDLRRRRRRT